MQLVFGPLGDRFGKARIITMALAGGAIAALVTALAKDFDTLVLARIAWGMAAGGIIPLSLAWVGDAVPYEQRQATLARLLTGILSGMMAGQLAGGLFADAGLGWRGAFFMMAAGYAIVALLLFARLRHVTAAAAAAPPAPLREQLRAVLGNAWSFRVLGSALAEGIILVGPMAFLPAYLHKRFGISVSAAAAMVALSAVGGLLYAMTARHLVTHWGERRMVWRGGWMLAAGFAIWLISPVAWTAAPAALVVGFGTYLYPNTLQTHATQLAPTARGTAVGLFAFCLFFGQAIGVMWAGAAFDRFGTHAMLVPPMLLLPVATGLFAAALRRRHAQS
jgi:predicted MFS family arabinose efflux permease